MAEDYGRKTRAHKVGPRNSDPAVKVPTRLIVKTTDQDADPYRSFEPALTVFLDDTYFYLYTSGSGPRRKTIISLKG